MHEEEQLLQLWTDHLLCHLNMVSGSVSRWMIVVRVGNDTDDLLLGYDEDLEGYKEIEETSSLVKGLRKWSLRVALPSSDEPWGGRLIIQNSEFRMKIL